jgi:potassium-transporting ATPase potassium-binding subunit
MRIDQHVSPLQSGGNMEGKEVRFGIANSALFATVTTDASCGAVNSMHDSFMPLGGLVRMASSAPRSCGQLSPNADAS